MYSVVQLYCVQCSVDAHNSATSTTTYLYSQIFVSYSWEDARLRLDLCHPHSMCPYWHRRIVCGHVVSPRRKHLRLPICRPRIHLWDVPLYNSRRSAPGYVADHWIFTLLQCNGSSNAVFNSIGQNTVYNDIYQYASTIKKLKHPWANESPRIVLQHLLSIRRAVVTVLTVRPPLRRQRLLHTGIGLSGYSPRTTHHRHNTHSLESIRDTFVTC